MGSARPPAWGLWGAGGIELLPPWVGTSVSPASGGAETQSSESEPKIATERIWGLLGVTPGAGA